MSSDAPKKTEEDVPPIPRRPLTTYNIFSILERHYILQNSPQPTATELLEEEAAVDQTLDPYHATRPPRYASILLPPEWYVVGKNRKKRQQHKNHGIIGFKKLSRMISKAWNEADASTKEYCKIISKDELAKYREEQRAYKDRYGEEAFDKQTRKRKNAEAAERGEGKKNKSTKRYEEALRVLEAGQKEGEIGDEKKNKVDGAASRLAGGVESLSSLQAQRLNLLTNGSSAVQGDDRLGQMIRSMHEERLLAQELAFQRSFVAGGPGSGLAQHLGYGNPLGMHQDDRLAHALRLRDARFPSVGVDAVLPYDTLSAAGVVGSGGTVASSAAAPSNKDRLDLSNPVVLDHIQKIQRLQQHRLRLQEQMLQQRLCLSNAVAAGTGMPEPMFSRQVTPEEILALQVEERNVAMALLAMYH